MKLRGCCFKDPCCYLSDKNILAVNALLTLCKTLYLRRRSVLLRSQPETSAVMATILPFLVQCREAQRVRRHGLAAKIIIFPGVRYERMQDCDLKVLPCKAARVGQVQKRDR